MSIDAVKGVALGAAALAVGALIPIVESQILKAIQKRRGVSAKLNSATALPVLVVCLVAGSAVLVFLSSLDRTAAPVIVAAAMAGLGLVRWRRKEL